MQSVGNAMQRDSGISTLARYVVEDSNSHLTPA
jgi:hypothetical protein